MKRKKRVVEERFTLVADIQSIERGYFISEENNFQRVDEEANLTIEGTIQEISKKYRRHSGQTIKMLFLCARSFRRDESVPATERPLLMSVNLRGEYRSVSAYLPADAFWALPGMISSGAVTHIEAQFGPTRHGQAELHYVHFTTAARLEADRLHL